MEDGRVPQQLPDSSGRETGLCSLPCAPFPGRDLTQGTTAVSVSWVSPGGGASSSARLGGIGHGEVRVPAWARLLFPGGLAEALPGPTWERRGQALAGSS